jgi:hypothetical protein
MKTLLALLIAAGASAQDMAIAPNQVQVKNTLAERVYTISQSTNLDSWEEIASQRGNGSVITYDFPFDRPQAFFKAKGVYDPVQPLSQDISYPHMPHQDYPTIMPVMITNYKTNNIDVRLSFVETANPYNLSYSNSMPFVVTLVPGDNMINTYCYWTSRVGTGGTLYGIVNAEIVQTKIISISRKRRR